MKKSSKERQIVSPSDSQRATPPVETERVSEQDQFAAEEKIRRGDGGGVPSQQPSAAQQPSPARNQDKGKQLPRKAKAEKAIDTPREKVKRSEKPIRAAPDATRDEKTEKSSQPLTNLRLDSSTLEEKFGQPQQRKPKQRDAKSQDTASKAQAPPSMAQYQAFSRPPGSGAAFLGSGGLSDYLPNLPDGDITLLNAKASQYAGFVRRVAVQVFTQLRTRGWEDLTAAEVRRIGDFTIVEAVLSIDGKLQEVRLVGSSGSQPFDGVLGEATKAGARDPNPPPGAAAADGRIHFIFKARSWSSTSANPRNGAPFERRWLLLATGLE